MESPSGMIRTPTFDSACADVLPATVTTAARASPKIAAAICLERFRIAILPKSEDGQGVHLDLGVVGEGDRPQFLARVESHGEAVEVGRRPVGALAGLDPVRH